MIGSGPAGAVAALVAARGGARVALVDRAEFPRDKACGDLVGPRGVQLLADLGVPVPGDVAVSDMLVIGPGGRAVRLPSRSGLTFPGYALAVPRALFDGLLRDRALEAGVMAVTSRAQRLAAGRPGDTAGVLLEDGRLLAADVVIGADGATGMVGEAAGLVDTRRVLWGFATRCYLPGAVELPTIVLWEPVRGRAFPGYGWIFPGAGGLANVGLGIGAGHDRRQGARAARLLPAFVDHLRRVGLLASPGGGPDTAADPALTNVALPGRLGGWLKMGMVGTVPSAGRVLLVGDAAGLVNPLQGEGIAQAMASGWSAAAAVLRGPARAAERYRAELRRAHLPYFRIAAALHARLAASPVGVSALGRLLCAPGIAELVAGGWAVFWNELLRGASPGVATDVARAVTTAGDLATRRGDVDRWFEETLGELATPVSVPTASSARSSSGTSRPRGGAAGT